jgi:hypothetical protein
MPLRIILAVSVFAFCVPILAAPTISPAAIPKNLHVYDGSGNTYVDLVAGQCTGSRYFINPDHVKYDAMVSILLAAQVSGKKVQVRYDGCSNNGVQGRVIGVYLLE